MNKFESMILLGFLYIGGQAVEAASQPIVTNADSLKIEKRRLREELNNLKTISISVIKISVEAFIIIKNRITILKNDLEGANLIDNFTGVRAGIAQIRADIEGLAATEPVAEQEEVVLVPIAPESLNK